MQHIEIGYEPQFVKDVWALLSLMSRHELSTPLSVTRRRDVDALHVQVGARDFASWYGLLDSQAITTFDHDSGVHVRVIGCIDNAARTQIELVAVLPHGTKVDVS